MWFYRRGKYFRTLIFCNYDLQTGISQEINLHCASGTVLLSHCVIPVTVGTCIILLGTCPTAGVFKQLVIHQNTDVERDVAP